MSNQSTLSPLLLVEDTPSLQMLYRTILRKAGYNTICASNGQQALAKFSEAMPSVVLLDLMLPDSDGMVVMREMLALQPNTRIIVITANGSINAAVEATRAGAHDFLVKPLGDIRLISAVANAHAESRRDLPADIEGNEHTADAIDSTFLGQSEVMQQLYQKISAVATSMAPVFVLGESGTGKELCARAVHLKSARSKNRFVTFNCSAIPHELQEAELFGQAQRSNAPASGIKPGTMIKADAGSLFLENLHDMTPTVQAKLLHFLQHGTVAPLGSGDQVRVDVRIICAATRDPAEDVRAGKLREDLYYRLFVIPIHVPPLRARGEDVNVLARHLLVQIAQEEGKTFTALAPETSIIFRNAPWRGNLRELVNVLRLAVVLHDGPVVTPDMLPPELSAHGKSGKSAISDSMPTGATPADVLSGMTMAQIEELVITSAIRRNAGSVPKAARELDIAPSTIYRKRDTWASTDE
ncbi:sigma-54-dependent transcriptional regulator [Roseinatronobacter alkalisoli]|uniref:Sigma-54 dependent transcriptional regulator n=1 Tax=Roseinatronobacter alkalisoli TaxID=3028235 RepID=A0ABT5T410_9RHOB|nr:sigma-54 dependent transcriptional regulator [Roseinatronobacter sp. HJB301]MDD7969739.1 sigma-54 dependent transcriptional regulator [Roseinatronobacter sp. HJB301]